MSRVDTATGKGGGRRTENPAPEAEDGGIRPKDDQPARFTGQMQAKESGDKPEGSQDRQQG